MAAGRPVICLDLGGPALQVTPETGIKVPAMSPEQVVHDLAAAFSRLAGDSGLRVRLGKAGRQRVEQHFNWDKKGEWMNRVYSLRKDGFDITHETEIVPPLAES
jgi:glycosyltransferase involved in cell wall biosynthesis